jgi:hypothetical protein
MADLDGNVYVPMYMREAEDRTVAVAVSHDYGVTWKTVRAAPEGMGSLGIDPDIAIDKAGNVYLLYEGGDATARMAVSRDFGETWGEAVEVQPAGVGSVRFVAGIAGDEGKLAIAYLGSPDTDRDSNFAPFWARWHLYVAFTDDALAARPVFRAARATSADDPLQLGGICTRGVACTGQRNLLDFIDASLTPEGRVVVAYTDGCNEVCTRGGESTASRVKVAFAELGPLLLQGSTNLATATSERPSRVSA